MRQRSKSLHSSSGRTRPLGTRQPSSRQSRCARARGRRRGAGARPDLADEVETAEEAARQKTTELAEREVAVHGTEGAVEERDAAAGRREKACDERHARLLRREHEVAAREDAVKEIMDIAASLRRREREVEGREKAVGVRESVLGPVADTREAADTGQGSSLEGEEYLATLICTCTLVCTCNRS